MKHDYSEFRELVKAELRKRLACFEPTDEDFENFLKAEEDQIKGEYRHYSEDPLPDGMTPEAFYKSCVASIAMCLEYCY